MRASVIGIQPRPGCTPLLAPSQFSQYPCSTLPAGRDFTAQVPPVGGGVVGGVDVGGLLVGGLVVGGLLVGGFVVGGFVVGGLVEVGGVPVQAPRSRHRAGTAA